jgi:glycosyltransferase involved in cell wall biosynthesis
MSKKWVLHVHQKFLPYQGGSTQRLLNLIDNDQEFNHVVLCTNSESVNSFSSVNGIDIFRFDKYADIPRLMYLIKQKYDISIIHLHNYRPAFWGLIGRIFFHNVKVIFELHSVYIPSTLTGRLLASFIHKFNRTAIVLSESSVTAVKKLGFKGDIHVVRNGIDIERFRNSKQVKSLISNRIVIGYIGSLEAFQGVENFCVVAKSVSKIRDDISFIVVGGTEVQHNAMKKIAGNSVNFHTFFSTDMVPSLYNGIDALLMCRPSLPETESAIPLKPLEALAAKVPVLSTDVGGMKELKISLQTNNIRLFHEIPEIIDFIKNSSPSDFEFNDNLDLSMFDKDNNKAILNNIYKEIISG